ncbi:MAG: MMPL family transporter [Deltaproteobacteria bacterium]|nr:MMPL family transporter [Deltaproteobacteria bacterium]
MLLALGITAFLGSKIIDPATGELHLEVDPSTDRLLPEGDESRAFLDRVTKIFGNHESLLVALVTDDVFDLESLATIKRVSRALEEVDGVHHVVSLATALNMRSSDGDLEIEPFLATLPETREAAERLRHDVQRNPLYSGSLVSHDSRTTSIVLYLDDMPLQQFIDDGLDLLIERTAREGAPQMEVLLTGSPHIKATTSRLIFRGLGRILPLAFLIMGLLGAIAFRSVLGVLVPMVTVVVTTIWTFGVVAWLGVSLNLVTTIIPTLLVTVGAAYALHIVSEYYRSMPVASGTPDDDGGPVALALRHVALPVALTGLTTAAGLVALTISPFTAVREFGLIAVLGVAFAVITSLTVVPAMMQLFWSSKPARSSQADADPDTDVAVDVAIEVAVNVEPEPQGRLDRLLEALGKFDVRHRSAILAAGAALFVLSIVGMQAIEVNSDLISNFSADNPVRANFERINQQLEGAIPIYVVIESDVADAFVQSENLRVIEELQAWLEEQPEVGGTSSIVDYVKTLNRVLHDDASEYFTVPDENTRYLKQLLLFGAGEGLRGVVGARHQITNIQIRSQAMNTLGMAKLVGRIESRFDSLPSHLQARVTGSMVLLTRALDDSAQGQARTLGVAFLFIYLILVALFTSFRVGFIALIPNALPVLIYFGALGLTGVPLNTTTGLFACIVLGIAVDDTIHFLTRFNSEARGRADEKLGAIHALVEVGRPVTITTIGLCLGFLVLSTSELKNQVEFGVLGAFTLAVAWLVDVTFTPALCAGMRVVNLWDALTFDLGKDPQNSIPVLHGLSKAEARIAALMTNITTFAAGDPIFRVGEPGDELYVLLDGELVVSIEGSGGKRLELSRCKRGDVVGEVALYHGKRTADVDALTDARALRLTRDNLESLRIRYPRIGARVFWNLSEILAERVANVTRRVV